MRVTRPIGYRVPRNRKRRGLALAVERAMRLVELRKYNRELTERVVGEIVRVQAQLVQPGESN